MSSAMNPTEQPRPFLHQLKSALMRDTPAFGGINPLPATSRRSAAGDACRGCGGEGEFDCEECEGTGEVDGQTCDACTGIGKTECEDCEEES